MHLAALHRFRPGTTRRARGQRGELLIETLLTVMLMASVIVGGSYMLATTVKVSASHQDIVRTTDEAAVAAEALERIVYLPCGATGTGAPTVANYQALLDAEYTVPIGLTAGIKLDSVTFLGDVAASTAAFATTCPATDQGAQKLTVRVQSTSGSTIGSSIVFLKRNASCQDAAGVDRLSGGAQPGQTC